MGSRFVIALIALAACESSSGSGSSKGGAKLAESGTKRGSAGGFAATLGAEMGAPEGSIGAAGAAPGAAPAPAPAAAQGSATPTAGGAAPAGSATPTPAPAGSAAPAAGSATPPAPTPAPAAGSAAPAAGSAASTPAPAAGSAAKVEAPAVAEAPAKPGKGAIGAVAAPAKRSPVKPSAELAAIKFDLEPNWERDIGEAGTFSLVVKVPNTDDTRLFSVRYGYEDQAAPADCDQYRKFLDEKKLMKVSGNRQRGAACYIEGVDTGGVEAFRYMINYGGKRLMCHGSRYRDGASASLGDLRDKVLQQAKKICETMTL